MTRNCCALCVVVFNYLCVYNLGSCIHWYLSAAADHHHCYQLWSSIVITIQPSPMLLNTWHGNNTNVVQPQNTSIIKKHTSSQPPSCKSSPQHHLPHSKQRRILRRPPHHHARRRLLPPSPSPSPSPHHVGVLCRLQHVHALLHTVRKATHYKLFGFSRNSWFGWKLYLCGTQHDIVS